MPENTHEEGTEHVEADEIKDGKTAPTGMVTFSWVVVCFQGIWVTPLIWETRQHDFLPSFTSSTPDKKEIDAWEKRHPISRKECPSHYFGFIAMVMFWGAEGFDGLKLNGYKTQLVLARVLLIWWWCVVLCAMRLHFPWGVRASVWEYC